MSKFYKIDSKQAFEDITDIEVKIKDIKAVFQNPGVINSQQVVELFKQVQYAANLIGIFNHNLELYLKANIITIEMAEEYKERLYRAYNAHIPVRFSDDISLSGQDDDLPF